MSALIQIQNTTIKVDVDGRYRITDLHTASGAGDAKKPSNFLAKPDVVELIAEMELHIAGWPAIRTQVGRYGGTYIHEDLVIAYAMFVSPKFYHEVIQTFKAVKNGTYQAPPVVKPPTKKELAKLYFDAECEIEQLETQIEHDKPAVTIAEKVCDISTAIPLDDFAKTLDMGSTELKKELLERDYLINKNGTYRMSSKAFDGGYMKMKAGNSAAGIRPEILVTGEGIKFITLILKEPKLVDTTLISWPRKFID